MITTDALIIGAGPCGLFQVFELGLQGIQATSSTHYRKSVGSVPPYILISPFMTFLRSRL